MQLDTWFGPEDSASLGFLHVPDGGARGGVVICPPLGYEQVLGYRGLRLLSQELEARGIASLRFDYLGEGDASGDTAVPDAAQNWLATIEQAVLTLRSAGVERIVLAGLAAGALLASEAARRIRDLEGLVLWDPALSGHRFVRRQKSLFDLTVGEPATDPERLTLLSLALHPDAVAWLESAELGPVAVDALALIRRADLESPAVQRFTAALPAGSSVVPIDGHAEWIEAAAALSVLPVGSIRSIVDWVDARLPADRSPVIPRIRHEARVATAPDGAPIVERLLRFGPEQLFAIETVRADAAEGVVVLQPGAAEHRVGPGRFQVIAARELASRGTRAIRFDRRITGDSTPVRIGEPNLIFAEEWIDDVDTLVRQLVGDAPVAHVGLCSGAWVAARMADLRPTRLTVLLSPTYFKLQGMEADGYAEASRLDQAGRTPFRALKGVIRDRMPGWAWRMAARLQLFHDPGTLLGAATRRPDTTVALMLTPEDTESFAHHRGPDAVSRLRARGADLRLTDYPYGDHSLFGAQVRAAMLRDVLELAGQSFAPDPVPLRGGLAQMNPLHRIRGIGLFGLSVILNGGVALISIPVIVAIVGAEPWASMATGQAIGASFGVLTIFGWGLTGPVTIAMARPEGRPKIFLDSLFARGVLLVPLLGVQAAVTFAIVPHEKPVAFLAGVAMMLAGASANWYFTGEARADRFLLLDTVPRVSGTLIGAVAVAATGNLLLFALGQLLGAIVALVISAVVIFRGSTLDIRAAAHWPTITRSLLEQRHGVVATAVFAAYIPAVLALIALMVPALLPMFVLADRVGKFVAMAVSPLLQVFQGWVPAASGPELARRIRISGWVALATALVAGGTYTLLLPSFSELLTHGQVVFGVSATIAFGLNLTMAILSPYLTNVGLMTVGKVRVVAVSVVAGVITSLAGVFVAASVDGPAFTFWALVAGNLVMAVWQFALLTTTLLRIGEPPVPSRETVERVPAAVP